MEQDKIVLTKNLSLLFVISFLYMFVGVHYGLSNHDEGAFAYGGARVFTGDVPYRDFWTFYPQVNSIYWLVFLRFLENR